MGPLTLGFDTATPDTAVAVTGGPEPFERLVAPGESGRPAHGETLLEAVEEAVEGAGGWEQVGLIGVGVGPGSFTGLRIGVSTARALAQARGLPLVGVSTTAALIAGIEAPGRARLAVIDARRAEVFAALDDGTGAGHPVVCRPDELAGNLGPDALAGALAAGDGSVRFRSEVEALGAEVLPASHPAHRLSARHICALAEGAEPEPPEQVVPTYLRRPDAKRWQP